MRYTPFEQYSEETVDAVENIKNNIKIRCESLTYFNPKFYKLMIDYNAENFIDIYAEKLFDYCIHNMDLERFKKLMERERLIEHHLFHNTLCKLNSVVLRGCRNLKLIDVMSDEDIKELTCFQYKNFDDNNKINFHDDNTWSADLTPNKTQIF